jgi:hypothetical protein
MKYSKRARLFWAMVAEPGLCAFFFVIVRSLYWMLQRKKSFPVQHLRNFSHFWFPHPVADFLFAAR